MNENAGHDERILQAIDSYRSFATTLGKRNRMRLSRGESLYKFDPYQGQGRILRQLASTDGITQIQLAALLGVTPQALSVALRKLDAARLIERGHDRLDKRVRTVFLTDEGRKVEQAVEARANYAGSMFEALDDEEIEQFTAIANKLTQHLEGEIEAAEQIGAWPGLDSSGDSAAASADGELTSDEASFPVVLPPDSSTEAD